MKNSYWILALLLMSCGEGGNGGGGQAAMQEFVGKNVANLVVQTLDGETQALKDVAADGKPVVLNVWATWCTPCLKEMPTLDALGREGKYTVVAIATDKDTQVVKDYLKKQEWGLGVKVWFDALGAVTRKELGAIGIPVTYVLDKDLTVVMVEAGERSWNHPKMLLKMEKALAK